MDPVNTVLSHYTTKPAAMHETLPGALALAGKMINETETSNHSLFSGNAGTLYYYYHSYRLTGRMNYLEKINRLAGSLATEAFKESADDFSLATGTTGMCSVLHLLHEKKLIKHLPPEALRTDEYLFHYCMQASSTTGFSFTSGTAGIASYFCKRGDSALIRKYLADLLPRLLETELEEDTATELDFTLWHGLCGKLSLLFRLLELFPNKPQLRVRLLHYLHILRNHVLQIDAGLNRFSFFPVSADEKTGLVMAPNYLFWEMGDLPIVQLLYKAYFVFGNDEYKKLADVVGGYTFIRKTLEETQVEDPCFGSGATGTALMYRLLERTSGITNYRKAYAYWINRSVTMFAGQVENNLFLQPAHGLVNGLTGMAMAWMDHLYSDAQDWTNLLLP